ncbi:hypothetical protein [Ponticaulis sp.]|uniref:hypothetical protein n=1 Tax=Ponticaulis sp. TaxID=2020902 RepID=UPI000B6FDFD1|nr:hypothetical protein [Ponticaulis sp.]MAI89383.1 hypothetical protein [Ponticaulis sp.]OUY00423.1 MAG: hypothetical protein CBB65_02985 [Hyphomonadaceae bacterium TMED5]|tara:strand:- start:23575 stop:24813 length:1239 start_codon:yes stop_codon:yes gene_type:complete
MRTLIGVIAPDERRDELKEELVRHNLTPAPEHFDSERVGGVLIDGATFSETTLSEIRLPDSSRAFNAILAQSSLDDVQTSGLTLTPSVASFRQQFEIFIRQLEVRNEARLREQSLGAFNQSCTPRVDSAQDDQKHLLYFGEPGAFYLKFRIAAEAQGFSVRAALSERTAFEALRTLHPAAFVVHLKDGFYPFELLDHVNGRTDLKDMPVIGVTDVTEILPENIDALSALVRFGLQFDDAIVRLGSLIDRSEIPAPVRAYECAAPVRDKYSDTFSLDFAEHHISRQTEHAKENFSALSIVRIEPFNCDTGALIEASELSGFASILKTLTRKQDMIARADWSSFLLSLPGTDLAKAKAAIERTRRILEITPTRSGTKFSFNARFAELKPYQNSTQLLNELKRTERRTTTQTSVA